MPLPSSGQIDMSQINTELSFPATTLISLNQADARALAGVPAGMISLSDFYGKSNITGAGYFFGGYAGGLPAPTNQLNTIGKFSFPTETGVMLGTVMASPWNAAGSLTGLGSTDTDGYILNGTPTSLSTFRFAFTSDTFTQTAAYTGTFNPLESGVSGSRMQNPTANYYQQNTRYNPSLDPRNYNSYVSKYTFSTMVYTSLVSQMTGTAGNNQSGYVRNSNFLSWSANKNFAKGFTDGGQRPFSPFPQPAVWSYAIQFPTETGYTKPVSITPFAGGNILPAPFQSANYGYGFTQQVVSQPPAGWTTFSCKFTFATETGIWNGANTGIRLSSAVAWQTPTEGYIYGGYLEAFTTANIRNGVYKFSFSTETTTNISTSLPVRVISQYGVQSGPVYG